MGHSGQQPPSTALERSQPTQPWPTLLPEAPWGAIMLWPLQENISALWGSGLTPRECGQMLPPHHHQEQGEGRSKGVCLLLDRSGSASGPAGSWRGSAFTKMNTSCLVLGPKRQRVLAGSALFYVCSRLSKEKKGLSNCKKLLSMHTLSLAYSIYWLC